MTKSPKTGAKGSATSSTAKNGTTTDRPEPAEPGVIGATDIGAGKPGLAGQPGEVRPIDSTLLGDEAGGHPPAARHDVEAETEAPATEIAAKSPPAETPLAETPLAAPPARKGGFWPLALGGAVAAGLGAAAAIYVLPQLSTPAPVDEAALIVAAEDAARRVVSEELAALPAGEAPDAAALPPELAEGIAQQSARLDALEERLAALPDAAEAPEPAPDLSPQLAELQDRLDAQQAQLDELAARPAFDSEAAQSLQQQIEEAAAEAQTRLDAAQAEADALQEAAAASTRRAEAVAAIAALQSALDQGVTPEEARAALEAAGLDAPEALAQQVPSLTRLQADYPEAARTALRAGLRSESAEGQGNLVTNFLRAQTGARSVAPREGDDPDAVLSRADAEVRQGRIAAALDELAALPEAARTAPVMADWLARAQAYAQAQAALSDLSSDQN